MSDSKRKPGPKPGSSRSPEALKPGPAPLPESEKVVRKNVSLYAWEWARLQRGCEGPTEAVRRLIQETED